MSTVRGKAREKSRDKGLFSEQYNVTDRVIWTALCNSPKHFMPGDKLRGTVINVFDNGGRPTYRIVLDVFWNDTAISQSIGEQIVIGNIGGGSLVRCIDES